MVRNNENEGEIMRGERGFFGFLPILHISGFGQVRAKLDSAIYLLVW